VSSIAVIQPKQGIGDVIWHLPFIRAIAATTPTRAVTFLTLPSTHAQQLLQAEACVDRTLYFENRGSELKRGLDLLRLTTMLRQLRCDTIWILDKTLRPAVAAAAAGIPRRIGLGLGPQRLLITNPGIDRSHFHDHPIDWLIALMAAMKVPLPTTEPNLHLPAEALAVVRNRFRQWPRPWTVLALGSHHERDWPVPQWTEFLAAMRRRTTGTVFLIGGPEQAATAQELIKPGGSAPAVNACDLRLIEAAALLREADLFVGPDSGPMNIAAAVGIPAFGLFGASKVLTYSRFIHAIRPDDGRPATADGMRRISPAAVMARIEPYLGPEPLPRQL
jgi:heptosyltransferase-2